MSKAIPIATALLLLSVFDVQAQQVVLRTSTFSSGGGASDDGAVVLHSTLGGLAGRSANAQHMLGHGFWYQVATPGAAVAAPTATDDQVTTDEDTAVNINVLANDTSPAEGGDVTVTISTPPAHGTLNVDNPGSIDYTPDADFYGADAFTYILANEQGGQDAATVSITVNPVNDAPVFASTPETDAVVASAYAYTVETTDVEGDDLTIRAPTAPLWLTLTDHGDGTATLDGTPAATDVGSHAVTLAVSDGRATTEQSFTIMVAENTATDEEAEVPTEFRLAPNYPNPFNPTTTIAYDVPQRVPVHLAVYDVQGHAVATLVDAVQSPGRYEVVFEAGRLASGTYFYRLDAGVFTATRPLVLLK